MNRIPIFLMPGLAAGPEIFENIAGASKATSAVSKAANCEADMAITCACVKLGTYAVVSA